jgi:hypothetical protein
MFLAPLVLQHPSECRQTVGVGKSDLGLFFWDADIQSIAEC